MDILDTRPNLNAMVLKHEQEIKDISKHLLALNKKEKKEWIGLTDEEIWETVSRIGTSDSDVNPYAKLADARAIESALREKNK